MCGVALSKRKEKKNDLSRQPQYRYSSTQVVTQRAGGNESKENETEPNLVIIPTCAKATILDRVTLIGCSVESSTPAPAMKT